MLHSFYLFRRQKNEALSICGHVKETRKKDIRAFREHASDACVFKEGNFVRFCGQPLATGPSLLATTKMQNVRYFPC